MGDPFTFSKFDVCRLHPKTFYLYLKEEFHEKIYPCSISCGLIMLKTFAELVQLVSFIDCLLCLLMGQMSLHLSGLMLQETYSSDEADEILAEDDLLPRQQRIEQRWGRTDFFSPFQQRLEQRKRPDSKEAFLELDPYNQYSAQPTFHLQNAEAKDIFESKQIPGTGFQGGVITPHHQYRRSESLPFMAGGKPPRSVQKSFSSPRMDKLTSSSNWLDDRVMDHAMKIVKRHFPHIQGLQETCVASVFGQHGLRKQSGKFLQIVNTKGNHWILLSNMGWDHHHVRVFDSCYRKLNPDTRNCIVAMVPTSNNSIRVLMPTYQRQENQSDCGLFAVAALFALAQGQDPAKCYWDSNGMRPFLHQCLQSESCQLFPNSRTRVKQLRSKEYEINVCTKCCNFPSDNPASGLCTECQRSWGILY